MKYMLQKMVSVKSTSCKKCGAEKETSVNIICECLALERLMRKSLGRVLMESNQIKEVRLSGIVALGKGTGMLYDRLEDIGKWARKP